MVLGEMSQQRHPGVAQQVEAWMVGGDTALAADQRLATHLDPRLAGGLDERLELGAVPVVVDGTAVALELLAREPVVAGPADTPSASSET